MKKSWKAGLFLPGFVVCLAAALAVIWIDNSNYDDKMEILYTILTAENLQDNEISLVTGILKGNRSEELERAKELLDEYGYMEDYENIYRKELLQRRVVIGSAAVAVWGASVIVIFLTEAVCRKKHETEISGIQEAVSFIRNKKGKGCLPVLPQEEKSMDHTLGRLWLEIESLASYVVLTSEQAAAEKEETKALVTDISHQLKTPVAALKTSFEILNANDLTNAERTEFEARCGLQIVRLQELVAALVNISRMEKGMIVIKKENRRIFDTVVLAMNRVYQNAQDKQIEVSVEALDEIQGRMIAHDPKWLAEAIINLLENAIKYSPNGSAITIRLVQMSTFLRIEIEDEGIGVPKSEWNLIFRRFYRGQSNEVQSQQGSGVGLFLARKILEQHGGTLAVRMPQGKERGSLFVMQVGE